ncbi:MAG: hypothetical protein CMN94_10290 [Synechococcus sp. EAC657]|nr:hypothetical protein [Synechococcus sp. EAC657]
MNQESQLPMGLKPKKQHRAQQHSGHECMDLFEQSALQSPQGLKDMNDVHSIQAIAPTMSLCQNCE